MREIKMSGKAVFRGCCLALFVGLFLTVALATDGTTSKNGNMAVFYGMTTLLALGLVIGCLRLIGKKNVWFPILYISVFVVNLGYFAISVSKTLEAALVANGISYLGSVFLPLSMLMIIMKVCKLQAKNWMMAALVSISVLTFLLAASADSLGLYYTDVSVEYVGGVAVLKKVYGPLHGWYLVYLLSYFAGMTGSILYSTVRKKIDSLQHGLILLSLSLGNIAVWYIEQKVQWNFEFLSVTYIITEVLLLLLYDMLQNYTLLQEHAALATKQRTVNESRIEQILRCSPVLEVLTTREREVLRYLLKDMPRKEIAETLYVTENTVKKHTSNIFFKLEVASRKELRQKLDQGTPRDT